MWEVIEYAGPDLHGLGDDIEGQLEGSHRYSFERRDEAEGFAGQIAQSMALTLAELTGRTFVVDDDPERSLWWVQMLSTPNEWGGFVWQVEVARHGESANF